MIAFPSKKTFDPLHDAPTGHRVAVIEQSTDSCPLHWEGVLIGVDIHSIDGVCWRIVDDSGMSLSLPFSRIADWQLDDVRLAREAVR